MYTLTFRVGDIAHCPYYNYTGKIVELKEANGQHWVILQNPYLADSCATKVVTQSLNELYPSYLQMICTLADYNAISMIKIWGHPIEQTLNKK